MSERPFKLSAVDHSHDSHDRFIDPIERAIIARAKSIEGKAKPFEPFDARWTPDGVFRQGAQVVRDVVAIHSGQTIQIRRRSPRELDGETHRTCVLAT